MLDSLSQLTLNPPASLLGCSPPKYILNPTNVYYLHFYSTSPGHHLLPEPWSSLNQLLPLQSILCTLASCDLWKAFMKMHHASGKALQMLPAAIRIQTYSLCQVLQVLYDLDPASSFSIMLQRHWPTFGPSKPTVYPHLTTSVLVQPST